MELGRTGCASKSSWREVGHVTILLASFLTGTLTSFFPIVFEEEGSEKCELCPTVLRLLLNMSYLRRPPMFSGNGRDQIWNEMHEEWAEYMYGEGNSPAL